MSTLPPAPSDQPEDVYVARVLFAADHGLDPHDVSEQDAVGMLDHARAWLIVRDASDTWRAHDDNRRAASLEVTEPAADSAAFRMYRKMQAERDQARAEALDYSGRVARASQELNEANRRADAWCKDAQTLKDQHSATVAELEQARRDLVPVDQLRGALTAALDTVAELRPQRDDADARAQRAEQQLHDANVEIGRLSGHASGLQAGSDHLERELNKVRADLSAAQHTIALVRRQAATIISDINYDQHNPVVDPS